MYDETHGVIYEVIMRVSMEPFWGLKIGKYVDYQTHVSSEYIYIKSWELLSPISTAGQTSRVLLADVIPWINKASLMCNATNQPDIQKLYGTVEFISCNWSIKTYHYWGRELLSDSMRHQYQCGL